jgi:hypothetical protein
VVPVGLVTGAGQRSGPHDLFEAVSPPSPGEVSSGSQGAQRRRAPICHGAIEHYPACNFGLIQCLCNKIQDMIDSTYERLAPGVARF